ncbi:anti-sigma B factor RsbW [Siminovitchia sp. FSL H7-0308]|jgi:serine/threonine-protein kinase RsbW|uniref:Serine-protein kinase RsbW n=1 Tax=Siminovitchia thermophila TaxID=1245522 RepID=A0ABS2RDY9_9BACI|nr:anti-sigma B factor RsbW [Siminovitchia thermophila]MBM7717570.1 serine/threonine-protein kinase RsbW [Siminovitchia thermophila]ONK23506.1 anti-sigma B factor RsbW [Bacillus sp. VT-16-64]
MEASFDYIEMKVPAKPEYVGVIRLTLSGIASRMGFSYEVIEDIKIATSEAVTNAVQHAYNREENGEVVVGFALYENRLEVMVADSGKSFDIKETRAETGPYSNGEQVEFLREGGLGLYLIESLMDEVNVKLHKGVSVFMTKFLEREQVEMDAEKIST